jgi:hypothetical protein
MRYLRTALVAAAATAAFMVTSTASAQINTAQIGTTAQLGPEGATITVPVTVNCDVGFVASSGLIVFQSVGNRLNSGSGSPPNPTTCTGFDQTLSVPVLACCFPFKQGRAIASGTMFVFNPMGEAVTVTLGPQEIRIRK